MPHRPHHDSSEIARLPSPRGPLTNRAVRMEAIEQVAERQALVLSRRQLRDAGWTRFQVDHEVEIGRWQSPAPGVVVLHTGGLEGDQPLWVGVLHAGEGAVLTHLTAARRDGLKWAGRPVIDVLTPRGDAVL